MSDDTREKLRASLANNTDTKSSGAWMPNPGDELYGEFVGWDTGKTQRGTSCRIALVDDAETGERVSVWTLYKR